MSWLIVPVTVILLRGALAVLILAGAEKICGNVLRPSVRRLLWSLCILLMVLPQPDFGFQPFSIDMSGYWERVLETADVLPRKLSAIAGRTELGHTVGLAIEEKEWDTPILSTRNYPYFFGVLLAVVPAALFVLTGYIRCRKNTMKFRKVDDPEILAVWERVHGMNPAPLLLDSGEENHSPVLFGFFTQKILLPVRGIKKLSSTQLELLLTHEYIHYMSNDGLLNILTLCLWPFCWYNPFFLAARRHLRISCEMACDTKVLKRYPDRVSEYGNLLLSYAKTQKPPEIMLGFHEYAGELRNRILCIAEPEYKLRIKWFAAVTVFLALVSPFALVSVFAEDPEDSSPIRNPAAAHLLIRPLPADSASPEVCRVWKIEYPAGFPRLHLNLRITSGGQSVSASLRKMPDKITLISIPSSPDGQILMLGVGDSSNAAAGICMTGSADLSRIQFEENPVVLSLNNKAFSPVTEQEKTLFTVSLEMLL